jgi:hypothetical protein
MVIRFANSVDRMLGIASQFSDVALFVVDTSAGKEQQNQGCCGMRLIAKLEIRILATL